MLPTTRPRRTRSIPALLLGIAAAILLVTEAAAVGIGGGASPSPGRIGSSSLGDPFYPDLGNGGYDVGRYTLEVAWEPPTTTHPLGAAAVTTVIDAVATHQLGELSLDLSRANSELRTVHIDGVAVEPGTDATGEKLVLRPPTVIDEGARFRIRVHALVEPLTVPKAGRASVDASPAPTIDTADGRGLLPDADGGVFLAAQPNGAHTLFPSNDHPTDKADLEITLTAPPGMLAVATGTLIRQSAMSDGRLVSTYRSGHPVATHVISLAVGRFSLVTDVTSAGLPLRFAIPAAFAQAPEWRLDSVPDAIDWLASELGPYPLDAFGIVVTPPGASEAILEGQTLIIMPAAVFDPRLTDCAWRQLLVHEASHQWFGDSVSLTRWDEKWLSEGHARFLDLRWAAESGCDERSFEARMRDAYEAAGAIREAHGPPGRPNAPADAYTAAIYEGGALVLFALRETVGAETFDAIERAYLARFADGNASTADFIDVASELGGRSVRQLLDVWLYAADLPPMPGHPFWTSGRATPSLGP